MSPTIELAESLFQTGPSIISPSCLQWELRASQWLLRIEAHAPGVFRFRCGPQAWLEPAKPSAREQRHADMLLARQEAVGELVCEDTPDGWQITQGDAQLRLPRARLGVQLARADAALVQAGIEAPDADGFWRLHWDLQPTEAVLGLGESQHSLERNGEVRCQHLPEQRFLPLSWSPRGWGFCVSTLHELCHDLQDAENYAVSTQAPGLDLFIFVGEPTEILNQYTALTGRAGQPDLWPLGVWLDQAPGQELPDTLQLVKKLRAQGMAMDAVLLADPMILAFQADKPVLEWSARIADWRALMAQTEELQIHLAGSCLPGVLQGSLLFEEWEDRGWLLADEDGNPWVCPGSAASGGKPFALLDLSHKDAARLWSERLQQAIDDGFGAPVCQAQFDLPANIEARGGESGAVLRTAWPHLVRRALFDALAAPRTPQEGVMLSRDLFPGVQRFAWQQGPEVDNTWEGYRASLLAALSTGNSGVAIQTHGLGHHSRPLDQMNSELYLRWLAMAVFSANFSLQGIDGLLPDSFGAATEALVQHWLQWRYRLLPYIAGIMDDAVRTGLPVQRSMALCFPEDVQAHAWSSQYMLGPALLVAPVMQPGAECEVYLPAGSAWWDLRTGWRYEGGTTWIMDCPLDTIPVFGREGHMLCVGPAVAHTAEINSARILEEVWMFGMPEHNPVVMRNKIRVMQMQGSSYIKGLEGLKIMPSEGLEVKRRGAEVRISRAR